MKYKGRTIQIFLPYGSPRGIKIAEITNRTVQAIYIPRNQLSLAAERQELENVGIYFLFGQSEDDSKPEVYIGEAENCLARLKEHNRTKDFWESAVVFITNNMQNQFTKTDVKFLESYAYKMTNDISRYKLDQTVPQKSFVPEWRIVDLYDIFETIKILISTLGFPLFEELRSSNEICTRDIYYCMGKGVTSSGVYTEDGFVVLKNSYMYKDTTKSIHNYLITKREALINDGVVIPQGDYYIFTEDHLFTSPSQAAAIVLGRNANGWIEWKNEEGKTLDQLKRNEL